MHWTLSHLAFVVAFVALLIAVCTASPVAMPNAHRIAKTTSIVATIIWLVLEISGIDLR